MRMLEEETQREGLGSVPQTGKEGGTQACEEVEGPLGKGKKGWSRCPQEGADHPGGGSKKREEAQAGTPLVV